MTFDIQGQAGQTTLESKRSGQLKCRLKYPDFVQTTLVPKSFDYQFMATLN